MFIKIFYNRIFNPLPIFSKIFTRSIFLILRYRISIFIVSLFTYIVRSFFNIFLEGRLGNEENRSTVKILRNWKAQESTYFLGIYFRFSATTNNCTEEIRDTILLTIFPINFTQIWNRFEIYGMAEVQIWTRCDIPINWYIDGNIEIELLISVLYYSFKSNFSTVRRKILKKN